MRSTFTGLNTMVRGIMNNQMSLDTTGHNITNAGTEGYSRQAVNSAATRGQMQGSIYGQVLIGTGVDAMSIQRARDIYADIQYRNENSVQQYYKTLSVNFDKIETIFDDSQELGVQKALEDFYQSWVDLSTTSSTAASRTQVIEQGRTLTNVIQTAVEELQKQINSEYEDIADEVGGLNEIMQHIVDLNKQIIAQEATGATANDLRDQRDLLTDNLSDYVNISVSEDEKGSYLINSGGITLVNGVERTHLDMSKPISSKVYGVNYGVMDYNVKIVESNIVFLPQNGILKARFDAIEECKSFIDKMADMANFFLSTFNDQHKQGYDLDGSHQYEDSEGNPSTDISNINTTEAGRVKYYYEDGGIKIAVDTDKVIVDKDGKYRMLVENTGGESSTTTYRIDTDHELKKIDGEAYKRLDDSKKFVIRVPDSYNFFGNEKAEYEYRYDPELKINYLFNADESDEDKQLLTGVDIIDLFRVNSVFSENRGYRYVAAATSKTYKEETDDDGNTVGEWVEMPWNDRTGDGINAVYMSELFNLQFDTITSEEKANADLLREKCIFVDKDGKNILDSDGEIQYATAITRLSINSFYQRGMAQLGLDANAVDVNYDAMEVILTQISNWRDATAGVDWNEELTNMIKFQKGYASCSRCLTAMDEMLDRLINNTGVVGR